MSYWVRYVKVCRVRGEEFHRTWGKWLRDSMYEDFKVVTVYFHEYKVCKNFYNFLHQGPYLWFHMPYSTLTKHIKYNIFSNHITNICQHISNKPWLHWLVLLWQHDNVSLSHLLTKKTKCIIFTVFGGSSDFAYCNCILTTNWVYFLSLYLLVY